ncbi:unnamed protein product [Prunus armeniaca]
MDSHLTEWANNLVRENNKKRLSLQVSPIEAYSFHVYDGCRVEVLGIRQIGWYLMTYEIELSYLQLQEKGTADARKRESHHAEKNHQLVSVQVVVQPAIIDKLAKIRLLFILPHR